MSTNKYPAAIIPSSVKTAFARLYLVQSESGKRRRDFLDEVRSSGYDISKRSFNRYIEMVSAGGTGFSPSKMSGKKAALAEDERELLAGWLLCEVDAHRCVHLDADFLIRYREALKLLETRLAPHFFKNRLCDVILA